MSLTSYSTTDPLIPQPVRDTQAVLDYLREQKRKQSMAEQFRIHPDFKPHQSPSNLFSSANKIANDNQNYVLVRNTWDVAVEPGTVFYLGDPVESPLSELAELPDFRIPNHWTMCPKSVVLPTSAKPITVHMAQQGSSRWFCNAGEVAAAVGALFKAVYCGPAWLWVDIIDADDEWCEIPPNEVEVADSLTVPHPEAHRILWKDGGTGVQRCIVDLNTKNPNSIFKAKTQEPTTGTSGVVSVKFWMCYGGTWSETGDEFDVYVTPDKVTTGDYADLAQYFPCLPSGTVVDVRYWNGDWFLDRSILTHVGKHE